MAFVSPEHDAAAAGPTPGTTAAGHLLRRAAMAAGIGVLVLVGWSATAAAEEGPTPTPSAPATASATASDVGRGLGATVAPISTALTPAATRTTAAVAPVVDPVLAVATAADPVAPVVVPVVAAVEPVVAPVVQDVVAPVVRATVAPVLEDVVVPVVAPTLEPVTEAVRDGLPVLPTTPTTEALDDLLGPATEPALAPVVPLADGTQVIDAVDVDRRLAVDGARAPGAATDRSSAAEAVDGPATADRPTGVEVLPAATSGPLDPTSSTPDNSPCSPRTCAAGGLLVLTTVAAMGGLTATSRRISARTPRVDGRAGRPQPQPGFAPD